MTERRGDQGFAVVTQSVTGRGRGRGPRRLGGIGVAVVAVAAIVLIAVGFLGPRLSAPPNFDVSYFATPTPEPTPEPTYPRPVATPVITPLPVITTTDGVDLTGSVLIGGDALRSLDLATGTTQRLHDAALWQDAVFMTGPDRYVCVCVVDDFDVSLGRVRTIDLVRIDGKEVTKQTLDRLKTSPAASSDQPDPLLDVAVDSDHRMGLLALAKRTKTDWQITVRLLDVGAGTLGGESKVGRVALPAFPPSASPAPAPSNPSQPENLYLDGPHIRLAPDGRTAVVWAIAQRYREDGEPAITTGAWRIRLDVDGSVADVAQAPDLVSYPQFCVGIAFVAADRLAALCGDANTASAYPVWFLRTFDKDGTKMNETQLPEARDYGYAEPLVDQANHRMYLWDPIALRIVRAELDSGALDVATFDPAASTAAGVAGGAAPLAPQWHDGDSAVQQMLFPSLAGSSDGRHLYAVGMNPTQTVDSYNVAALGVFVIDPATLALEARWAPAANDVWVATLPDGRVATGGQPGLTTDGANALWEGSMTIHDQSDGRILARYGRVSTDQPPVLIGP